jgi:Holliday junction DNA helicase RuvA
MVYTTGASLATLREGDTYMLHTHFVVREDAHDLYGFLERAERTFFMLVLTVNGIGPKSALQILDKAHYTKLRDAIAKGDLVFLTKIANIGTKTAQKLILELRDKIGAVEGGTNEDADAFEALTVLGYSLDDARKALEQVPADVTKVEHRIRAALRLLGKK